MKSTSDSSSSSFFDLFASSSSSPSEENNDISNNTVTTPIHSSQNINYYEYDDIVSQTTINRYQPDQRLPQWPSPNPNATTATKPDDKILVVYSGPTSIPSTTGSLNSTIEAKSMLYKLNFDYFLKYGIQCQIHDTVIVLGGEVGRQYQTAIEQIHSECKQKYNHFVKLAYRQPVCYDMESVRRVVHDKDVISNLDEYDYFVYINCGVSGPSKYWSRHGEWISTLLGPMKTNPTVKMTGLNVNCATNRLAHVQSMVYALGKF
jgi:hypothetical protein